VTRGAFEVIRSFKLGDSGFGSTELGVRSRMELPGHNPCVSIHSCALELPLATVCIER